ncbi:phage tail protein [Variovorax sp. ZT5P49]|uniref:phage tail protein n=1 Tax=Variovorax sp. ZT5P49 TaxID=3443733 RepID=UPI003F4688C8
MAITTTLAACNTNPTLNGPDGADLPSTLDDAIRYALSFIAQLRDGAGLPVGMVAPFVGGTSAPGWIKLNGALVSRTTYAALFAYASAQGLVSEATWTASNQGRFSVGDGSTTFRLPDTRAMFIRGLDESRGIDTGRGIGTFQDQDNSPHAHGVSDPTHNHGDPGHFHTGSTSDSGDHAHIYSGWNPSGAGAGVGATTVYAPSSTGTSPSGNHAHTFSTTTRTTGIQAASTGVSIQSQGTEGHPRNLAWPMYIKF